MKWKRILAIAGAVLILSMYIIAVIAAFSHNPQSKNWLMAAIFSTFAIPVFIYAAQLVGKLIRPDKNHPDSSGH